MDLQKGQKVNRLITLLPEGVAAPSSWLEANGFSRQLVRQYTMRGVLSAVGKGAYFRPQVPLTVDGIVLGLQKLAGKTVHIGARSALNRLGQAHYLSLAGEPYTELWSNDRLPAWVEGAKLREGRLIPVRKALFGPGMDNAGLLDWPTRYRDWSIRISGPERAMMEVFGKLGDTDAEFNHAAELFEGLTGLRPRLITELLKGCSSIKVKRLFLFFAMHYKHAWTKRIVPHDFDLGKGKRQVVKGGSFNATFGITIPGGFDAGRF